MFLLGCAGQPLLLRCAAKFLMFSSKVRCEELVLRSLNASPLIKPNNDNNNNNNSNSNNNNNTLFYRTSTEIYQQR